MRAALQIADGSPASRVRTREDKRLRWGCEYRGEGGWGFGGWWLLDDKHTEPHIHVQSAWHETTSSCVSSSFRLSVSSSSNHTYLRSHTQQLSQRPIHTVVTNHPSGADILRSGWQSAHAHKYRLMPFSTKGLGCITVRQVGWGGVLMTWHREAWTGEEASDITDKGDVLRLAAMWSWQVCTCTWFQ